jgi:hypothetical protein
MYGLNQTESAIDITPPVNQFDRGQRVKPISDRYMFQSKMPAKSTFFFRQATYLYK